MSPLERRCRTLLRAYLAGSGDSEATKSSPRCWSPASPVSDGRPFATQGR
jgi:hypothetical protein